MEIGRNTWQPARKAPLGHCSGTVCIDRSALAVLCGVALFGTASCGTAAQRQTTFMGEQKAVQASSAEMRLDVVELARTASAQVEQAADAIRSRSENENVRREALLWKVNAIPQIQTAALQPDPLVAAMDLWAFILQMRNYFATGAGAAALGPEAAVALNAIHKMEAHVQEVAQRVSTAGGKNGRPIVEKWASDHPITSSNFARDGMTAEYAYTLREGHKGGFAAIGETQATMERLEYRLALVSEYLPKEARWNAELAAGDVLGVHEIQSTLVNLNTTMLNASKLLVATPEMISGEREAAMSSVREERIAALLSVNQQRQLMIEGLEQEREAALKQVDDMRQETMKEADAMATRQLTAAVDHLLLRLVQLAGAIALLGGLIWLLLRLAGKRGPRAAAHLPPGSHAPAH